MALSENFTTSEVGSFAATTGTVVKNGGETEVSVGATKHKHARVFFKVAPRKTGINIVELQDKLNLSSNELGKFLNVSHKTVQDWITNKCEPKGAALRLLHVLDGNPQIVSQLADIDRPKKRRGRAARISA